MRINELLKLKESSDTLLSKIPKSILEKLQYLNKIYNQSGYEIRLVGGAVRDLLLNKTPKDWDLASNATPEQSKELLNKNGIRTLDTGLQHGTISAILGDDTLEITTLRIDKTTDGRHAEVEYTKDFKTDAERRDLTINSMSLDLNGKLYDYFNGLDDLKNGRIRFVTNPENNEYEDIERRIMEDGLRILRYFRFFSRFGAKSIDEKTKAAIEKLSPRLKQISGERIWNELKGILMSSDPTQAIQAMNEMNVLKCIDISMSPDLDNLKKLKRVTNDPSTLMVSCWPNKILLNQLNQRYHWSSEERDKINFLVDNLNNPIDLKGAELALLNGSNKVWLSDLSLLQGKNELSHHILTVVLKPFPVNGNDLINLGIKPGPEYGKIIKGLKSKWVDSGYRLTKDKLLKSIS